MWGFNIMQFNIMFRDCEK